MRWSVATWHSRRNLAFAWMKSVLARTRFVVDEGRMPAIADDAAAKLSGR
jgi:hypothetical protein